MCMTSFPARDNTVVQRRMRFCAVPVAESDIDATFMDTDEDDDTEYMTLTEGQARAGIEAALLHNKIRKDNGAAATTGKYQTKSVGPHPYRNRYGCRVMLTPRPENGEQSDQKKLNVLYGIISGYDIVHKHSADEAVVSNKVLILLQEDKDEGDNEMQMSPGIAFWSTIIDNSDGTTSLTDIVPIRPPGVGNSSVLSSMYYIEMHEFHQGSEAYSVCSSIIAYLKNQPKIGPFLQPVDHITLGLVDYLNVVKTPMACFLEIPCCKMDCSNTISYGHCYLQPPCLIQDVSTLEKNFHDGKYSRIRHRSNVNDVDEDDGTDHPVYRMVYGEFHDAIMLIFDNCIKYNSEASWIGGDASVLKKNVAKKIQQVVSKAVWQGQEQGLARRVSMLMTIAMLTCTSMRVTKSGLMVAVHARENRGRTGEEV